MTVKRGVLLFSAARDKLTFSRNCPLEKRKSVASHYIASYAAFPHGNETALFPGRPARRSFFQDLKRPISNQ
jgi:hypothetical protein